MQIWKLGCWWVSLCVALATALALTSAPVEAGLIKKVVKGAVIVGAVARYQAKKKSVQRAASEGATKGSKHAAVNQGKTLVIPKEKAGAFKNYEQAAADGKLVRTDPKSVRGSGFRKRLGEEQGPPPGKNHDADHKVELCVGGVDCPKTNGQWLESGANRSAGSKIGRQVRDDPVGTRYNKVEVEKD